MIISKTPNRISLLGGGSDYPKFYREHGGLVIGGSINKYSYLLLKKAAPYFDYKYRLVYSQIEHVTDVEDIQHKAIKACLDKTGVSTDFDGVEVLHASDLPSSCGIGSSSTFIVGLLNALACYKGLNAYYDPEYLAKAAIDIEQNTLAETVGCQDQIWAAYGGLNTIEFRKDGSYKVETLGLAHQEVEELQDHLLLFYTGITRRASDIASSYAASLDKNVAQADILDMAKRGIDILLRKRYDQFGKLLGQSWNAKRALSSTVSNPVLDGIYTRGIASGAFGGKVLGSGGGGCMLFVASPFSKKKIREAMDGYLEIPFKFEFGGSKIIMANGGT